ncbi:MAG: ribosome small subunit-dependent GTPase A [Gemmatimonadota bacterium]
MTVRSTGRILQSVGGVYSVEIGTAVVECSLRGRLKRGGLAAAVGDRVEVDQLEDGSCRIEAVLPRSSEFSRLSAARRREQLIAANVDQVAVVVAARTPQPDFPMLDRLLVLAELNDLPAFIVFNKVDLAGADESEPILAMYESLEYPVVRTCAKSGLGVPDLAERLANRTTVFAGASGVGKSSLLNALLPGLDLRVGKVGERSGRGRHTTVSARLIPLPGGGYLADTPGIQFVGVSGVGPADLAHAFPEFRPLLDDCKFSNCQHLDEPGCALKEALEAGSLDRGRFDSYLALAREPQRL